MRINFSRSIVLLALTAGQPSIAATLAVLPGSGGFQNSNYGSNITLGWGFTLVNAVTVTDLGYFDGNAGLTDAHPVGIWNSIGTLIANATVPSGAAAARIRLAVMQTVHLPISSVGRFRPSRLLRGCLSDPLISILRPTA